ERTARQCDPAEPVYFQRGAGPDRGPAVQGPVSARPGPGPGLPLPDCHADDAGAGYPLRQRHLFRSGAADCPVRLCRLVCPGQIPSARRGDRM
ncbi:Na(+) H(+) antiporter subunit F, partial [Pseudomonas sp. FEN]